MTNTQFDRKLNKAMNEYKANIKKELAKAKRDLKKEPNEDWIQNRILRLERDLEKGSPFNLVFKKRLKVFRNSSNKCEIDLINETGHSYHWWAMLKRINGHLCLNTFHYSSQTSQHIYKAKQVLGTLGVKYLSVDAPRGLQDLDSAAIYAAFELGRATIKYKYSRNKNKTWVQYCTKRIKTLAKIGIKVTKSMLKGAIEDAEASRIHKLERLRNRPKLITATEADKHKTG
jgi:hypothetical protein